MRRRDINLIGGGLRAVGEQVEAIDTGHDDVVYRRGSISGLLWPLAFLMLSVLGLWIWIRVVAIPVWRRLRKQRGTREADPADPVPVR